VFDLYNKFNDKVTAKMQIRKEGNNGRINWIW